MYGGVKHQTHGGQFLAQYYMDHLLPFICHRCNKAFIYLLLSLSLSDAPFLSYPAMHSIYLSICLSICLSTVCLSSRLYRSKSFINYLYQVPPRLLHLRPLLSPLCPLCRLVFRCPRRKVTFKRKQHKVACAASSQVICASDEFILERPLSLGTIADRAVLHSGGNCLVCLQVCMQDALFNRS